MRTAGATFVLACLVSGLLTPEVWPFALKLGLFDDNVEVGRSSKPRLRGIAIAAGVPRGAVGPAAGSNQHRGGMDHMNRIDGLQGGEGCYSATS